MTKISQYKPSIKLLIAGGITLVIGMITIFVNLFRAYSVLGECQGNVCPSIDNILIVNRIGQALIFLGLAAVTVGTTMLIIQELSKRKK